MIKRTEDMTTYYMYDGIIWKLDNICHSIIYSKTLYIYMYIEIICRYLIFLKSFKTVYETQ